MELFAPSGQRNALQSVAVFVLALAAGIALLYFGRAFWITISVSIILAFMLDPFVTLVMRLRLPRSVASVIVCTVGVFVLYLIGLGLFTQAATFLDDLPVYSQRINDLVDTVAERIERTEQNVYRLVVPKRFQERVPEPPPPPRTRRGRAAAQQQPPAEPQVQEVRIRQDRSVLVNFLYGYFSSVYHTLLMVSFVPFLVYFMLSWREHVGRAFLGLFQGQDQIAARNSQEAIAGIARAYVVGNFILGLVISLASCGIFWSWALPYWIVLGFISGFLSLIPYVGLPLALIPPIAAALVTYDTVTPFLVIAAEVGVLHLLALNLLYPAIVGARVHLNPLAVTVALMFWGTIWGAIGLVLAIPITAALKAFFDSSDNLRRYGRLLGD